MAEQPMGLEIKSNAGGGYNLFLDGKRIHHVEDYEVKSSTFGCKAELTLKMTVSFPATQESTVQKEPVSHEKEVLDVFSERFRGFDTPMSGAPLLIEVVNAFINGKASIEEVESISKDVPKIIKAITKA